MTTEFDEGSEKTCLACRYYEKRTGFCRRNPPVSVVSTVEGKSYYNSVFPKISKPNLDFCWEFTLEDSQKDI